MSVRLPNLPHVSSFRPMHAGLSKFCFKLMGRTLPTNVNHLAFDTPDEGCAELH